MGDKINSEVKMHTAAMISYVLSGMVLIIQALMRYGLRKQEELTDQRFKVNESALDTLREEQRASVSKLTEILISINDVKAQLLHANEDQDRISGKYEELRRETISRDLFESRMKNVETNLANIAKGQNEILSEVVKWMRTQEWSTHEFPTSNQRLPRE